jgi:hypothetical protein
MIEQFFTPFCSTTMKHDRFFHNIQFLHFTNNDSTADKNDPNYDRLWKLRNVFDFLKYVYALSENLAVDEVTVISKGKVNSKQYIPKKHKGLKSKFTNYVTRLASHMTWKSVQGRTGHE